MKRLLSVCMILGLLGAFVLPAHGTELAPGAKSALLMEVSTGKILYESNAHEALPPASVTKVMTMLLIMEAIDSGSIGWEDPVTASEAAAAKGGSQVYLKPGETMTVSDMVKSIAVSSANDCACAMAEHIAGSESAFVDRMNEKARELGMADTHFVNCTGLDDSPEAAQHRTSAHDIALMSRALLKDHPKIKEYTTIWMDTVREGAFGLSNTNKLVRFYPGATGLKTGFTSQAGYCLSASAQRDGMELIAVVMGCETSAQRFGACKSMLDYGFAGFCVVQPEIPQLEGVAVKLGTKDRVEIQLGEYAPVLLEKGQKNTVTVQTELAEQVTAPVSKGSRLGTLTVKAGEQILCQIPLLAKEGVPRLTWGQIFLHMLKTTLGAK